MNNTQKETIEQLISDIYDLFELKSPLLNLNSVISKMNGVLITGKKNQIKKTKEDSFIIEIVPNNTCKERFMIGQLLGYLFLIMGYKIDKKQYNKTNFNSLNFQKNKKLLIYFSRAFLLPKHDFLIIFDSYRNDMTVDTVAIAEHFNVELPMISERGKDLGLYQTD